MTAQMRNVFSSMIAAVGYDDTTNELVVEFKNGRIAAYQGVPEAVVDELATTVSVGSMFNSQIKGQFPFRYLR